MIDFAGKSSSSSPILFNELDYFFSFIRKKKDKKFSDTAMVLANTRVWEARLDATEKSRQEFRENAKHLSLENELLQHNMLQSEKDTIDVITYLKKEDQSKEELVSFSQKKRGQKKRNSVDLWHPLYCEMKHAPVLKIYTEPRTQGQWF